MSTSESENAVSTAFNILLINNPTSAEEALLDRFQSHFCGTVYTTLDEFEEFLGNFNSEHEHRHSVYFCGELYNNFADHMKRLDAYNVYFIRECVRECGLQYVEAEYIDWQGIPQNIHNVGVWFPRLFQSDKNYFQDIESEHEFQSLTESDKPGWALRSGIYMTDVMEHGHGIGFNLLRCSSNFSGPTDNYRESDYVVVNTVNHKVVSCFEQCTILNHTLAQIYHNNVVNGRTHRAKIKEHSDKTKDMPRNGLIAFCTFYKEYDINKGFNLPHIKYDETNMDYKYKKESVLTRLRFRLKSEVQDPQYVKKFDVVLLPNSVFIIPLSTNRLYTHEIIPPTLESRLIPTRMGYVIRCSNTPAVYHDGHTYIHTGPEGIKLEEPTEEGIARLKELYYKENSTTQLVTYDQINFSLNKGDYSQPLV